MAQQKEKSRYWAFIYYEDSPIKNPKEKLIELGYAMPRYGADGGFGNETEKAVKQYQRDKRLVADGIIGKATWNEILR